MKRLLIIAYFATFSNLIFAQSDSTAFFAGKWETEKIDAGIILSQCHFTDGSLFDSNQYISVLTVSKGRFDIVATPRKSLMRTSQMAEEAGAVAAINGSFYNMRAPYNSVNYLRIDGEVIDGNGGASRTFLQNGAIATFNGEIFILKSDALKEWERYIYAEDVLTSGPVLRIGGIDQAQVETSFNKNRHPRTAIGKTADGKTVLVTVDGRTPQAAGVSMVELQNIMRWLGCESSINLDGGGSTTMVVNGKIVNYPCDNSKFDRNGERNVQNCVVLH